MKVEKNPKRIGNFIWVGIVLTIVDFIIYQILIHTFLSGDFGASIATSISGVFSTILAFFMHMNITWHDREVTRINSIKFFIWNILVMIVLRPVIIWFFSLLGVLYDFITFCISFTGLGRDFVANTCMYMFTTAVTMILNYLFYDNFVFGVKKEVN